MSRRALVTAIALGLCAAACALGDEEEPGCVDDSDCESGFVCRAGACFRHTTGLSPPNDPGLDAGDAGDAGDASPD